MNDHSPWMIGITVLFTLLFIASGFRLKKGPTALDIHFKELFSEKESGILKRLMRKLTILGNVEVLFVIVTPILFMLIKNREFEEASAIINSGLFTVLISQAGKFFFRRRRPIRGLSLNNIGYSYPSGHASVGTSVYLVLSYLVGLGNPSMSLMVGIGLFLGISIAASRVILAAHWFSDVLAGLGIGLLAAYWTIHFYEMGFYYRQFFH